LARLQAVQAQLLKAGQGDDNLEVWRVGPNMAIKHHHLG